MKYFFKNVENLVGLGRNFIIFILFNFFISFSFAQKGFEFINASQKKAQLRFKFINNLIVIPLEINGKELSFILDTGVNKTILFSLSEKDSVSLKNVEQINLQGLGEGNSVKALISKNNTLKITNTASFDETVYVILNDKFNFSAKMGTTIHGIIGYSVFKNFIVNINYNRKKIVFYNPKLYKYKKCRKCDDFPIKLYRRKPYIDAVVQMDTIGNQKTNVRLLIDSGGSDALWLFENSKTEIVTPTKYFDDILGEGLSGTIYGKRSRIPELKLGKFEFTEPTVSFLNDTSTSIAQKFNNRNGSIGGNILRRFNIWLDYPNQKIRLKKNSFFRNKFNYNMSGLRIIYNGQQIVKEAYSDRTKDSYNNNVEGNNLVSMVQKYKYLFKNSYVISRVLPNSPAGRAGLKEKDILIRMNGKQAYEYKLSDIISIFQSKKNKTIRMVIKRNGEKMKFRFKLERRI